MTTRIAQELGLLRGWCSGLEYEERARWVLLSAYRLPAAIWTTSQVDVAFQIPAQLPAEAPYGFYVRPGLALLTGQLPSNYTHPAAGPPFGQGPWGRFSWAPVAWRPAAERTRRGQHGGVLLPSILDRLREPS